MNSVLLRYNLHAEKEVLPNVSTIESYNHHHHQDTEDLCHPKKFSCFPLQSISFPQLYSLGVSDLIFDPKHYVNEIIKQFMCLIYFT